MKEGRLILNGLKIILEKFFFFNIFTVSQTLQFREADLLLMVYHLPKQWISPNEGS